MKPSQILEYIHDKNIAFANINRRISLLSDNANGLDLKARIVGGWNREITEGERRNFPEEMWIFENELEFFEAIPEDCRPEVVFILPKPGSDILVETENILAAAPFTIKALVVLLSTKVNSSIRTIKEIQKKCISFGIRAIFFEVNTLDYRLGYLFEEPDNMPWVYKTMDRDLRDSLKRYNIKDGTFLDIGTGTGHQAVELANIGFEVTATDLVPIAYEKAKNSTVNVEFLQDDILNTSLQKSFDYIFDRGCFHSFGASDRQVYLGQVSKLLKTEGVLFLKCFGKESTSEYGPAAFSEEELLKLFGEHFEIQEVKHTIYERDNVKDTAANAIFAVMKKK